jgi:hypothetical protein
MQTHATKWLMLESRLHRECVERTQASLRDAGVMGLTIPGALRRNIFGARAGVFAAAHLNMSER